MVNEAQDSIRKTPFAINLYNDLQYRVQSLLLRRENILQELDQTAVQADGVLKSVLSSQLDGVEEDLHKFEQELGLFGGGSLHPSNNIDTCVPPACSVCGQPSDADTDSDCLQLLPSIDVSSGGPTVRMFKGWKKIFVFDYGRIGKTLKSLYVRYQALLNRE